jgi:hypothetical protein
METIRRGTEHARHTLRELGFPCQQNVSLQRGFREGAAHPTEEVL